MIFELLVAGAFALATLRRCVYIAEFYPLSLTHIAICIYLCILLWYVVVVVGGCVDARSLRQRQTFARTKTGRGCCTARVIRRVGACHVTRRRSSRGLFAHLAPGIDVSAWPPIARFRESRDRASARRRQRTYVRSLVCLFVFQRVACSVATDRTSRGICEISRGTVCSFARARRAALCRRLHRSCERVNDLVRETDGAGEKSGGRAAFCGKSCRARNLRGLADRERSVGDARATFPRSFLPTFPTFMKTHFSVVATVDEGPLCNTSPASLASLSNRIVSAGEYPSSRIPALAEKKNTRPPACIVITIMR